MGVPIRIAKIVLPIVILAAGVLGTIALVRSKPPVETVVPEPVLPLVRVMTVQKHDVPLVVRTQGTVTPRTETTLAAQVAAEVVAVSPSFEVGGFFGRGETLVELDRRDFELAISEAEARLAQAELRLAQEEAEARVARQEWQELDGGEADPLVLREPQIAEAKAQVAAARAQLEKAELDLERTRVRAPFAGRVRSKEVDVGQYVTPGLPVATVHAVDWAEVRLPIPHRELAYLDVPVVSRQGETPGPPVTLAANFAGRDVAWPGRIVRTEGEIDDRTRMIYLVARVEDPYGQDGGRPPMAVGLFVEASIAGRTAEEVVLLPRVALRSEDQVLVADEEDRLRFRTVEVLRFDGEVAIVTSGLAVGELVCVSPLDVVVDGMRVKTTLVEGPEPPEPLPETSPPATSLEPPPPEMSPEPSSPPPVRRQMKGRLEGFELVGVEPEVTVRILVRGAPEPVVERAFDPDRAVIDLPGVVVADPWPRLDVGFGVVARVRAGQHEGWPEAVARVVFDLGSWVAPQVERDEEGILVRFPPP